MKGNKMKKILTVICLCFFLFMSAHVAAQPFYVGEDVVHLTRNWGTENVRLEGADKYVNTTPEEAKAVLDTLKNDPNLFIRTLNEYMNNGGCWFCSTFASLFRAINKLATDMFIKLTNLCLMLLGFGLLFVIVFKVGRMLIQLQEVNLMQFLQDLFKPLGRGIIAVAFLTTFSIGSVVSDDNIFSILISPFLELAFYLSSTILKAVIGG
jgi:hypothetical protein